MSIKKVDIISFSTGKVSALAWDRLASRGGKTIAVFMDTLFEDDDNYRFASDCLRYMKKKHGAKNIKYITLTEGRNPYEVSHAEHVIPNSLLAPCTNRLKIEPFRKYILENFTPSKTTIHIGYDFEEMHRCEATKKNYESIGFSVDFPMLWQPYEFRNYDTILRNEWGIEPPRMYAMGYTHANCGGCCVKQGQGDWIRTLINFPERYFAAENWEREMRKNPINSNYAILKETINKETRPLTLEELRLRYEKRQLPSLFMLDTKSTCVVCGIGG